MEPIKISEFLDIRNVANAVTLEEKAIKGVNDLLVRAAKNNENNVEFWIGYSLTQAWLAAFVKKFKDAGYHQVKIIQKCDNRDGYVMYGVRISGLLDL